MIKFGNVNRLKDVAEVLVGKQRNGALKLSLNNPYVGGLELGMMCVPINHVAMQHRNDAGVPRPKYT